MAITHGASGYIYGIPERIPVFVRPPGCLKFRLRFYQENFAKAFVRYEDRISCYHLKTVEGTKGIDVCEIGHPVRTNVASLPRFRKRSTGSLQRAAKDEGTHPKPPDMPGSIVIHDLEIGGRADFAPKTAPHDYRLGTITEVEKKIDRGGFAQVRIVIDLYP